MNTTSTFSCQCADCPGDRCRCGCQGDATPPAAAAAPQACTCGPRCDCSAAEQGCLCGTVQA